MAFEGWTDKELVEELLDIEYGLTPNDCDWVDILALEMKDYGSLTDKQREVAENILAWWKDRYE